MNELPTFNDYTVDVRLGEFRRGNSKIGLEIVPFASDEGKRLIEALDFLAFCCVGVLSEPTDARK